MGLNWMTGVSTPNRSSDLEWLHQVWCDIEHQLESSIEDEDGCMTSDEEKVLTHCHKVMTLWNTGDDGNEAETATLVAQTPGMLSMWNRVWEAWA